MFNNCVQEILIQGGRSQYVNDPSRNIYELENLSLNLTTCVYKKLNKIQDLNIFMRDYNNDNFVPYYVCANLLIVYISDKLTSNDKKDGLANQIKLIPISNIINIIATLIFIRNAKPDVHTDEIFVEISEEVKVDDNKPSELMNRRVAIEIQENDTDTKEALEKAREQRKQAIKAVAATNSESNLDKQAPEGKKNVAALAQFLFNNMEIQTPDQLKEARSKKASTALTAPKVLEAVAGGEFILKDEYLKVDEENPDGPKITDKDKIKAKLEGCGLPPPLVMKFKMMSGMLQPVQFRDSMIGDTSPLDVKQKECVDDIFTISESDSPQPIRPAIAKKEFKPSESGVGHGADVMAQLKAAMERRKSSASTAMTPSNSYGKNFVEEVNIIEEKMAPSRRRKSKRKSRRRKSKRKSKRKSRRRRVSFPEK